MAYNVGAGEKMADSWMKAAGQSGIPCCFVIDKQGKIAWIGHPLMGLDEALDLALQDKLNEKAAKRIAETWEFNLSRAEELDADLEKSLAAGKYADALAKNDEFMQVAPFALPNAVANKYLILTHTDPPAAAAFADSLLTKYANAPIVLYTLAGQILDPTSKLQTRDYSLAVKLTLQAQKSLPAAPITLRLAQAYARAGDTDNAQKTQTAALAQLADDGASRTEIDQAKKDFAAALGK
jgi:hypothetical protein